MDNAKELEVMADITHAALDFTKDEVDEICSALDPKAREEAEVQTAIGNGEAASMEQRKRKLSVDRVEGSIKLDEEVHGDETSSFEIVHQKPVRQGPVEVSAFSVFKCFDGMGSCSTILRAINRRINNGASVSDDHGRERKRQLGAQKNPAITPAKRKKQRSNHQRKTKISPAGGPVVCASKAKKRCRSKKKKSSNAVADAL